MAYKHVYSNIFEEISILGYLPSTTIVTVISFKDAFSWPSENKSESTLSLIEVNVGCLGNGRLTVSLSSINTTDDIVGL